MVLHVTALLHAHEMLHRVQVLSGTGAGQELLHGHGIPQVHGRVRVVGHGHLVGALCLIARAAHLHRAAAGSTVGTRQDRGATLGGPRPASRLFSSDGDRAQMNAWNEETVNTPNLFSVFFVGRDTWVRSDWMWVGGISR